MDLAMQNTHMYLVKSIQINAAFKDVFDYVANPGNLPKWTNAFKEANNSSAVMATPEGELEIKLKTKAISDAGTVDWYMTLPDGTMGAAYSRVTENVPGSGCIYSFILLAPPVPLEQLEGTLTQQGNILEHELRNLANILNKE
jgi:hypothetical protein